MAERKAELRLGFSYLILNGERDQKTAAGLLCASRFNSVVAVEPEGIVDEDSLHKLGEYSAYRLLEADGMTSYEALLGTAEFVHSFDQIIDPENVIKEQLKAQLLKPKRRLIGKKEVIICR